MLNQTESSTNSLSQLVQNMFSDNNNNIMLAAIVSLLLVILFVLLLHVYAKWFLAQAELYSRTRRRRAPVTISGDPFSHFHHINIEPAPFSTKGLDSTTVSMIPTFVCEAIEEAKKAEELECVICLSDIEKGETGRRLPICGHVFHVECIDMWLSSHCNCPICRASIFQNDCQYCLGGGGRRGTGGAGDGDDGGGVEIVIGGTQNNEISESDSVSVSETSLSLLKRMLSKVFVSSHHVNELDGSQ